MIMHTLFILAAITASVDGSIEYESLFESGVVTASVGVEF